MVSPVNANTSSVPRTAVQPASTENQTQATGTAAATGSTATAGSTPVADELRRDTYAPGSATDPEVTDRLVRESAQTKPAVVRGTLSRGIEEPTVDEPQVDAPAESGGVAAAGGTAVARPPTPNEIADKYGVGGNELTNKMAEYARRGQAVPQWLQDAKRRELEAKGVDVNAIDAKQYLEKNGDVAWFWGTDKGVCDPQLAAAMHWEEFGKHEDRIGSGLDAARNDRPRPVDGPTADFNSMTTDQKYDYLMNRTIADAGGDPTAWKTGNRELNLVGVRSYSDGKLNDGKPDEYNDTVYACRLVDGKKEVYAFKASVDSGVFDEAEARGYSLGNQDGVKRGVANLADGFYRDAWTRGTVSGGDQGLRQCGWVKANADFNNDGIIQESERLGARGDGLIAGTALQMQFHSGGGDRVGSSSLGCQAIHESQWGDFQRLLQEAPASQRNFSYNLVDGRTLAAPDANGQVDFKTAGYDPINLYNEMNVANASNYGGMNFCAHGRGMIGGQVSGHAVWHPDGDYTLAAVSADGEGGIGIIQTPVGRPPPRPAPPPPPSWWPIA